MGRRRARGKTTPRDAATPVIAEVRGRTTPDIARYMGVPVGARYVAYDVNADGMAASMYLVQGDELVRIGGHITVCPDALGV